MVGTTAGDEALLHEERRYETLRIYSCAISKTHCGESATFSLFLISIRFMVLPRKDACCLRSPLAARALSSMRSSALRRLI